MRRKGKRFIVEIEVNTNLEQNVIIAKDTTGMYRVLQKVYGKSLFNERGECIGRISFKETELN